MSILLENGSNKRLTRLANSRNGESELQRIREFLSAEVQVVKGFSPAKASARLKTIAAGKTPDSKADMLISLTSDRTLLVREAGPRLRQLIPQFVGVYDEKHEGKDVFYAHVAVDQKTVKVNNVLLADGFHHTEKRNVTAKPETMKKFVITEASVKALIATLKSKKASKKVK